MSITTHAQIRFNTLNRCFRNIGRNYTIDDLLKECNEAIYNFNPKSKGIKKRQLQYDISFMKSEQGWSIELEEDLKIGDKKVYRYLNPKFSINNEPINESDANLLKLAILSLSRLEYDWADELSVRLREILNIENDPRKIIEFEENKFLKGKEYITQLYNAINYKKVLEIEYKNFKTQEVLTFVLHPYYLKQYNNRWFLFGKDERFDTLTNLALDRILKISETSHQYIEADIDFKEYFEDVIGVSISEEPIQKVILEVSNKSIDYMITKPLHGSQRIIEKNELYTIVGLELIPNYEFETLILSFAENIEVIEPIELRNKLKERIQKLDHLYSN